VVGEATGMSELGRDIAAAAVMLGLVLLVTWLFYAAFL
jgi:hypothetical protein